VTRRPAAAELLTTPGALLTRAHLRELGLSRVMVDAVFRELPVVVFDDAPRSAAVTREDYLALCRRSTYNRDRVRPTR
jgi:hypothetical protein